MINESNYWSLSQPQSASGWSFSFTSKIAKTCSVATIVKSTGKKNYEPGFLGLKWARPFLIWAPSMEATALKSLSLETGQAQALISMSLILAWAFSLEPRLVPLLISHSKFFFNSNWKALFQYVTKDCHSVWSNLKVLSSRFFAYGVVWANRRYGD